MTQGDEVTREMLRHLSRGWQGFIGILAKASAAGILIGADEVERLERMQAELAQVISRQHAMTKK